MPCFDLSITEAFMESYIRASFFNRSDCRITTLIATITRKIVFHHDYKAYITQRPEKTSEVQSALQLGQSLSNSFLEETEEIFLWIIATLTN